MATSQTFVRKITVGVPIRRVIGTDPQSLDDLLDVEIRNVADGDVLQFEAASGLFKNVSTLSGGNF